jgi:hypothetical protein
MHHHLFLLTAIFLLLVSWFINRYDYLSTWIDHLRCESSRVLVTDAIGRPSP